MHLRAVMMHMVAPCKQRGPTQATDRSAPGTAKIARELSRTAQIARCIAAHRVDRLVVEASQRGKPAQRGRSLRRSARLGHSQSSQSQSQSKSVTVTCVESGGAAELAGGLLLRRPPEAGTNRVRQEGIYLAWGPIV
eukprot:6838708-Pyramimonas_sp.AAC.1